MGFYEKMLGLAIVPGLYFLLLLLALGLARKQLNAIVQFLLKFNVVINGHTIYMFPLLACINAVSIIFLYAEL